MDDLLKSLAPLFDKVVLITALGAVTGIILTIIPRLFRIPGITGDPIPVSYRVAVIGLPGAGKTTLITALFELIQRGSDIPNVRLHGLNTIATVNRYIANLNAGEKIGPTKEKDTFVFRFSYTKRRRLIYRSFDIEIADFPGEFSEFISQNLDEQDKSPRKATRKDSKLLAAEDLEFTLFNKEFFSWIASSREYLFLIDLAAIYSGENPRRSVADIIARIRTSWQVIEDSASERGIGSTRNRPVHIIFTKTDSIVPIYAAKSNLYSLLEERTSPDSEANSASGAVDLKTEVASAGRASNLTPRRKEQQEFLNQLKSDNDYIFSDLLSFFKNRTKDVDVIYSSMVISELGGGRLGVRRILTACLP
jgi:hypothetical protein